MADDVAYFAVKSIGLSKINGRKPCSLMDAARHNLREIQSELGAVGRINPMQTSNNWILAGAEYAHGVVNLAQEIANSAGFELPYKRYDYCQAIELVFSVPNTSDIEPRKYFSTCLQWTERAYGLPVLSAVAHMDESSPHCHILLMPLNQDGEYVGGKPLAKSETKKQIESFFSEVALPAGLRRQGTKMRGALKQVAIDIVLDQCKADGLPAANGALWPIFEAAIKKDPVPSLEAMGIDRQHINERYKDQNSEQAKPLGIKPRSPKPLGIDTFSSKKPTLSSVGIGQQQSSDKDQNGGNSINKRGSELAMVKQQSNDDGLTRVKDEYAQDTTAWDD